MKQINILENPIRVSTPFVKVKIGDYVFGVFSHTSQSNVDSQGVYKLHHFKYPNYIQGLKITKINGQVNQYELSIKYPITQSSDPNFLEKVFSSVSKTRKITFSYGDLSAPKFVYRDEQAIITDVKNSFDINSAVISYTVSAVSSCKLATSGAFNFITSEYIGWHKPSDIIKKILFNNATYGLQDVFTGMTNEELVISKGLIKSDYLRYLVQSMRNSSSKSLYTFVVIDDTSDIFGGPYFKVINAEDNSDTLDTYVLDIGYPSANVITSFNIDNQESFSILYDYSKKLNTNEYVSRIDDGSIQEIYSPNISSNNNLQITRSSDLNWWKNVTEYPITATIQLKGLLRPAILMSKVRLNVLFYGKAHISSGTYIINKQIDTINLEGCWTTLSLVRVPGNTAKINRFEK